MGLNSENRPNISLRYVYPKEMERVLSNNGFEIIHILRIGIRML